MIKIYVDGSSRGNPGPGGSGVVVYDSIKKEVMYAFSQQYEHITNNQAELYALLYAIKLARSTYGNEYCIIYSDSAYCVNTCKSWIFNWARNNWKNSKNKTVENLEIMKVLYRLLTVTEPNYDIQKIAGHSGEIGNELADALATNDENKFEKILKENDVKYSLKYFLDNLKKI